MPGHSENRSWKWLAVLTMAAAVLVIIGMQIIHGLSDRTGQMHCDMVSVSGGPSCR
ncbi:hypothetical protein SAMN05216499_1612 [Actinacidiphila paucisporea]|uniref:Uncharacterized protein n=1 Tax=Actinacidiphila paucisporea TaxID=310782 RepID=A0A1M7R0N1_9ACTN|nr:hypothetical protein SAMN05216499_1612 [Actinacidiphila paucisporea]